MDQMYVRAAQGASVRATAVSTNSGTRRCSEVPTGRDRDGVDPTPARPSSGRRCVTRRTHQTLNLISIPSRLTCPAWLKPGTRDPRCRPYGSRLDRWPFMRPGRRLKTTTSHNLSKLGVGVDPDRTSRIHRKG